MKAGRRDMGVSRCAWVYRCKIRTHVHERTGDVILTMNSIFEKHFKSGKAMNDKSFPSINKKYHIGIRTDDEEIRR